MKSSLVHHLKIYTNPICWAVFSLGGFPPHKSFAQLGQIGSAAPSERSFREHLFEQITTIHQGVGSMVCRSQQHSAVSSGGCELFFCLWMARFWWMELMVVNETMNIL